MSSTVLPTRAANPAIGRVAERLFEYARDRTTFQTGRITTVPATDYTDPLRWRREMDSIFHRLPLLLALTAELPSPGNYKAMDAVGKPVLITRDQAGQVHAHLNVCAHRGAPVAEEGLGTASRLVCPYHAWTFGLDGALLAVAHARSFGPLDRSTRGLTRLPCVERAGMIFVVLTPGAPIDVDAFYGAFLDDFAAMGLADHTYLGSRALQGANWKVAFDGNLEGYHFSKLHPETIHPRTLSNLTHYEAFGPHLRIGFAQTAIAEKLGAIPREDWGGHENNGFDFVRILFPNVSVFVAPEIVQVMQTFPGPTPDRNQTRMIYVRRGAPRDDTDRAQIEQMMDFFLHVLTTEDYRVGLQVQKGLESGALDSIVLGQNERGNQFFHECVDWYVGGGKGAMPAL